MFIADIKGKLSVSELNSEDFLTSSVFSVFSYLNGRWLEKYLQQAINLDNKKLDISINNPEIDFWPWFSNKDSKAEPDLVVYSGNIAVIIEAKNYKGKSGEGTVIEEETSEEIIIDQLWREYFVGLNNILSAGYRDFYLIYLTRHPQLPVNELESTMGLIAKSDPEEVTRARSRICWLNWQKAVPILEEIEMTHPKQTIESKISRDLLLFLERRDLGVFSGFQFLDNHNNFPSLSDVMFFRKAHRPYWQFFNEYSKLDHLQILFYKKFNLPYWVFLNSTQRPTLYGNTIFYEEEIK